MSGTIHPQHIEEFEIPEAPKTEETLSVPADVYTNVPPREPIKRSQTSSIKDPYDNLQLPTGGTVAMPDPQVNRKSVIIESPTTTEGIRRWDLAIILAALLGSVFNTVALGTNSWIREGNNYTGLWTSCSCTPYKVSEARGWQISSQFFLGLALVVGLFMILAVTVYVAAELTTRKKQIMKLLILSSNGQALLLAIGCLPMGLLMDLKHQLYLGFWLCVLAMLLCLPPAALVRLKWHGPIGCNLVASSIVGLLLSSVHFLAVPYALHMWALEESTHSTVGLWINCVCGVDPIMGESWYLGVRGIVATTEITLVVTVFLVAALAGLSMAHPWRPGMVTAITILSYIAGIAILIAIVMFSASHSGGKGYSFVLCVLAGVCCLTNICIGVIRRTALGPLRRSSII